jgi:hypothetical protein
MDDMWDEKGSFVTDEMFEHRQDICSCFARGIVDSITPAQYKMMDEGQLKLDAVLGVNTYSAIKDRCTLYYRKKKEED